MDNKFFFMSLNFSCSCDSRIFFDFLYMLFNGRWGNWRWLVVIFNNTICGCGNFLCNHISIVLWCKLDGNLIVPLHTDYCGNLCGRGNLGNLLYVILFAFLLLISLLVDLHNYCMLLLRHLLFFFLIMHYNILIMIISNNFLYFFNYLHWLCLVFVLRLLINLIDCCSVGSGSWVRDTCFFTQTRNKLLGLIQGLHVWGQGGW